MRSFSLVAIILLGAMLMTSLPSTVSACVPNDDERPTHCVEFRYVAPTPTLVGFGSERALDTTRGGTSPLDPLAPGGFWRLLAPGVSEWYKIDNGSNFFLDIWLDANNNNGVNFLMFAPEQYNGLSVNTLPKGRGAPNKFDPSHNLFWSGAQARGVWYALVTNTSDSTVEFRLGLRQYTEDRNCKSYWEYIGKDYVYWTACR